jgi:hypothetical protein
VHSCLFLFLGIACIASAQSIPQVLWGKWVVKRELPTRSISCWGKKEARALIGTELEYSAESFRWGKTITKDPATDTRSLTAEEFHREYSGMGAISSQVTFEELGIKEPRVSQITIHHAATELTGGTIEIPGDQVLVKSRNTIVFSACGVYFEAVRKDSAKVSKP